MLPRLWFNPLTHLSRTREHLISTGHRFALLPQLANSRPLDHDLIGYIDCYLLLCSSTDNMTTIDLLHCYPPHKGDEKKAVESSEPNLTMPDLNPSQYFDPKTKLLHEMLDSVVKDLANSQPEPASPWDGTLWRSPHRPRSRSPTYSEISDSFESPARIEHCTKELLSTPISPKSPQVKGPDGWPLVVEVAMNDFHRGRLSTPILEKTELPNRLIVRKRQQQTSCFGGGDSRERQETGSCISVATEGQRDSQCQQENMILRPLAFQKQQSNVLVQQYDETQDNVDSASLKPLHSQQLGFTGLDEQSDCQYGHKSVDLQRTELQQQSDGGSQADCFYVPTLSARRYSGKGHSLLRNASTDLHPALTNDNLPIGLCLENAELKHSIIQSYGEEHDDYHAQTDGTYSLRKDCRPVVLSDALSTNKEIDEHAEPRLSTLVDAVDACSKRTSFSKVIGAVDNIGVESLDHKTGRYNTLEDSGDNKLHLLESPAPEDSNVSNVNTDSDIVSWRSSGLLKDVVEESEDLLTHTKTLDQRQPQHSTLGSAQPLHPQKAGEACERRNNMLALQGPNTKQRTPSSSPQRVPPTLKLTIITSTTSQSNLTKQSKRRPSDKKLAQSVPSAAKMAQLKDSTRKEGRLSPAALAEMRKTARSQPHFQTGPNSPEDQSQAQIHPLLRSKSFSRPSSPTSNIASNPALKYVFEDDDSECLENEKEDGVGHWISTKPCSSFETQAQNTESSINHAFNEEYTPPQSGKAMGNTMPMILYKKDDTEGQEAGHTERSNDKAFELSSKSMTLPSSMLPANWPLPMDGPSLSAVGSLDVLPSSIFQPPVLPATPGYYYLDSAIGTPATYNSWASTPHRHEHGNCCGTPSSATTLPTSAVPTLNSTLCSNSPASCGMTMTPASSVGQITVNLPASRGSEMTPSSSFGHFAGKTPDSRRAPITPSSSLGDFTDSKLNRRSISISSVFAHYRKARNTGLPTPATTDSIASSKESAEWVQSREIANDPFTSAHDSNTAFSLIVKTPSKENLAEIPSKGTDGFHTPTRRSSGRFSLSRRSLSTCRRPDTNEDLEQALSSLIFKPSRSRPQERSDRASRPIDSAKKPDGSGSGRGSSLNIATNNANTNWEIAPQPTPLLLRDEFSMRYRPEPLEAQDHHALRKDALQGVKQGLRKVFGRQ